MINPPLLTILLLGLAIILLIAWIIVLERRIKRLLGGKNGASLEDAVTDNQRQLAELQKFKKSVEDELVRLDQRIKKKLNGAKTLRFNPFAGTGSGGNQSFATALLDENGDGVVLSTLYSREKVSVFAKPIVKGGSEIELTEEEKAVLK